MAEPPLDTGVGHTGMGQVRQCIGRDHQGRGLEHVRVKEQVRQRCGQKHQARQAVKEVQHCVQVAQPLPELEALAEQRVVGARDLRHPPCPANALAHMAGQALGRQARRLGYFQIGRVVAQAAELERRVRILGHGFHRNAAHLHQFLAPDDGAGPAKERRIPEIVAVLDDAIEQLSLIGHAVERIQVALERVWREEHVRRLQHDQLGVLEEPAHADLQEGTGGNVVAVKNGNVVGTRHLQRLVDVACLGVVVVVTHQIAHVELGTEVAKLRPAAVVEHVNVQPVGRPVHAHGRENRLTHDPQRLVVGRNEHIHAGPGTDVLWHGNRAPLQRPRGLEIADQQHRKRVQLSQQQPIPERRIDDIGKPEGVRDAPVHVARRCRNGQHDHRQRRQPARGSAQDQRSPKRTS